MRMLTALAIIFVLSLTAAAETVQVTPPLYTNTCQKCHGADGKAHTTAGSKMQIPDLGSPQVQKLSDEEMFETIAYGKTHKQYPHAFAERGVSGRAIRDVIAFIRTLKAK
jgi:mono/diheme cytochrome c family protein